MPVGLRKGDVSYQIICDIIGIDSNKISSIVLVDKDMSQPEVILLDAQITLSETQTKEIMNVFQK